MLWVFNIPSLILKFLFKSSKWIIYFRIYLIQFLFIYFNIIQHYYFLLLKFLLNKDDIQEQTNQLLEGYRNRIIFNLDAIRTLSYELAEKYNLFLK